MKQAMIRMCFNLVVNKRRSIDKIPEEFREDVRIMIEEYQNEQRNKE